VDAEAFRRRVGSLGHALRELECYWPVQGPLQEPCKEALVIGAEQELKILRMNRRELWRANLLRMGQHILTDFADKLLNQFFGLPKRKKDFSQGTPGWG
jgi:hypothetical protein